MTREEAIFCEKSYIGETNCVDCKYYGTETCQSRESHKMAVKALEQKPRWIPVSERLPEERLGVLVWCPTRKNIYCACYEEKQWWIFGAYWEKVTEEIVAWRPLPIKPYSEVEE